MDQPATLPEKLYLLAYDPHRERVTATDRLDLVVRAAALAELLRRGLIREDGRHPAAVDGGPTDGLDPLTAALLEQIRQERRHSWQSWIGRRRGPTARAARVVRDGLAAAGRIRIEQRRVLGLFPCDRVTLREPGLRKSLVASVGSALTGPFSRIDPADAALVALVDAAQLGTVLTWRRRREFRARIDKLAPAAGPVPRALRRAVNAKRSDGSAGG
ncbi:Golgi phosphoprotein 3 GPP34 [Streptomyces sp. 1114.5]|uniref:GOLPH3/VPS74 family protein n=1 Tax=unclassified Streptomyces TaxID=2593676 RepID=UPI000BD1E8C9|nr:MULTISPECIES: GPP34 family phosphoprotein [unclassified Streptomyces]RKT18100.1 Golgi phosphoprotein 3 GPP34 [Streptomyces sp. 1114.5]SOB84319.1 Golgi phosphoprotein 3 (GPP34) [Streptomyces sp. 1331.2]